MATWPMYAFHHSTQLGEGEVYNAQQENILPKLWRSDSQRFTSRRDRNDCAYQVGHTNGKVHNEKSNHDSMDECKSESEQGMSTPSYYKMASSVEFHTTRGSPCRPNSFCPWEMSISVETTCWQITLIIDGIGRCIHIVIPFTGILNTLSVRRWIDVLTTSPLR